MYRRTGGACFCFVYFFIDLFVWCVCVRVCMCTERLMELLFEVTALDFQLLVDHSSFLDESWVIPVFREVHLPPIKTLDIKVK